MSFTFGVRRAVWSSLALALGITACADDGTARRLPDAGTPRPSGCGGTWGLACASPSECDDGCFCNGAEACTAGRCVAGAAPCDDGIACTEDQCLEDDARCVRLPRDEACSDGDACNGYETCDANEGCLPGEALRCDDGSSCTVDECSPERGCLHAVRDLDRDGFGDRLCGGEDCNDDPRTGADEYPGNPEICGDGVDQDCDDRVDYHDTDCPLANETCATPQPLVSGTLYNAFDHEDDYALACAFEATVDGVFTFDLAEPRDVSLQLRGLSGSGALAIRPRASCADEEADLACATGNGFSPPSAVLRNLPAGTYDVIAETPQDQVFSFAFSTTPPTQADRCGDDSVTITVPGFQREAGTWAALSDDYAPSCGAGDRADAAYRLVVTSRASLFVSASAAGGGAMRVALTEACGDPESELACASGDFSASLSLGSVEPGTYFVLVEPGDDASTGYSLAVSGYVP